MSSRAKPSFSVVVPTFDRAHVLRRAVRSVLRQEHRDFELLIVDDGSTDGTAEVVAELDDPRIRFLRQEHRGVSAARNLGISEAGGELVTFLDSDDEAAPGWLATFTGIFADRDVGVAAVGALVIRHADDGGELEREVLSPRRLGPLYGDRELSYTAGTLATRLDLLRSAGGYADPLRFAENAEMAMRLVPACLERGLEVVAVDRPLVTYHRNPAAWIDSRRAFESQRSGAEYILERHGDRMRALSPEGYANYRGVAAVNAARLGDTAAARRHLVAAIRADPRRWQSYVRLLLTLVPPLAVRYWTRHETAGAAPGGAP
ncbi:MAG: glycosyltransferase [Acidobacteriota bacterium]|jgi:glycosyltransferase involved in cell wall biosynthesis